MVKWNFFKSLANKTIFEQSKFKAEKRQKLNLKFIITVFGSSFGIVMLGILLFIPDDPRIESKPPSLDYSNASISKDSPASQPSQAAQTRFIGNTSPSYIRSTSGAMSNRSRNANQVIIRGATGGDPGARLSMGTLIRAQLQNTILSSNTGSPAIALSLQEVQSVGGISSIPQGTKILGSAGFDSQTRRIQIQFQNLIYDDGSQHSIQGIAIMPDGSAGLAGDYHSGEGSRQLGQFLGNFVGGIADGMKDRISNGGFYGGSIEPGSIKNGLLNGIATSASDQAKYLTNEIADEKPSMSIQAGFQFLIFLQQEYIP